MKAVCMPSRATRDWEKKDAHTLYAHIIYLIALFRWCHIEVRGFPSQDISSLGTMGTGLWPDSIVIVEGIVVVGGIRPGIAA